MDDKNPLIVTLNGKFFDVSEFASKHPGGQKILQKVAGEEISKYMAGQEKVLSVGHEHSSSAYDILSRYSLEGEFMKDEIIDSNDSTLWKIGYLQDNYWSWIHRPYDGTLRLFKTNFMESLTRTKWWMVPCVWMPVVIYYLLAGIDIFVTTKGSILGLFLAFSIFVTGSVAWTLFEYLLHRGLFHWKPNMKSYNQITLHFLLHGLHHKTPMDKDRLVFPPAAAFIIIAVLYTTYRIILPYSIFCCFAAGKLFGYICYDMIHYYLHHGSPSPNSMYHVKKVYHHNHHFKDTNAGFGISTIFWDRIFGTTGNI